MFPIAMVRWRRRLFERGGALLRRLLRLEIRRLRPAPPAAVNARAAYQARLVDFPFAPGQRVLDVGSGPFPFPRATVLADRYLGPTEHRARDLVRNGLPLVQADVARLPFADKAFDFVFCSHVLEHVEDPVAAGRELMRVAGAGYVETPAAASDLLFSWTPWVHRWQVVAVGPNLVFLEYGPRDREGMDGRPWREIVRGEWDHPLRRAYQESRDRFVTHLNWRGGVGIHVFRLDGKAQTLPPPAMA